MTRNWIPKDLPLDEDIASLSQEINVNPCLASILVQRGIDTFDKAKSFFRPSLSELHDPFLMKDMDKAVARLKAAMNNQERIMIYGDYDVDGTTSVALVYGFLRRIYDNIEYYIPDRYTEGYGVSIQGIEYAAKENIKLIVSLDCGIKAVDKVAKALEKGIDFIICDHHRPGDILPPAIAVLDPKRKDCEYPYKELSGCGVGYKLLEAYCIRQRLDKSMLLNFIDLVAVSIASDIVPITGENRVLAYFGLKKLNSAPLPGLKALMELGGLKENMDITAVVFGIGPRINAAGRIDHAKYAVELLLSEETKEAEALAIPININNTHRKDVDSNITIEALAMIEEDLLSKEAKSTVLFKNDWHKGVIGIVASRCIEKYYRPTIILTESNNKATGSARSVIGFDVYDAISECSDLLEQFGGHMYAAGLTMELDKVADFKQKFEEVVSRKIKEEHLTPQIEIDQCIDFDCINVRFYDIIKQMSPFGPGNMHPVFITENVYVAAKPQILKDVHLKLSVKQEGSTHRLDAIGFKMAEYFPIVSSGLPFKIAYCIEENNYRGNRMLQLILKDIKIQ